MSDEIKTITEPHHCEWERHYTAMNRSCEGLVELTKQLQGTITILEAEKKQWLEKEMAMNSVIHQALTTANAQSNLYLEENRQLKAEIAKSRG